MILLLYYVEFISIFQNVHQMVMEYILPSTNIFMLFLPIPYPKLLKKK